MRPERPFMTAQWTELAMLNFKVPAELIARIAPAGTEPDLFDGEAYLSIVGFMFRDARMFGLRFPGHGRFEEVNLRYYVRRAVDGGFRRGVVFVQEIAPRPIVAAVARWIYNESYVTFPMRNDCKLADSGLAAGDRVEYEWRTGPRRTRRWNRMEARAGAAPQLPAAGSLAEFVVEHYWAYIRGRDGSTWEYRVAHPPWRIAPASEMIWDCDLAATYNTPLAKYLAGPPVMGMIADGSPVQVFRGRRCNLAQQASLGARPRLDPSHPPSNEGTACRALPVVEVFPRR